MPELQLLKLLAGSVPSRLQVVRARSSQAGSMTLELLALTVILVTIATLVFVVLRSKVQQGVTRITLP
jgi:hypothetical protein